MKRRASPIASVIAIVAFVFSQLVIAAYACEMGIAHAAAAASQSSADCCDPGNTAPDTACHNHCQHASKAPERTVAFATAPSSESSLGASFRIAPVGRTTPPPVLQAPNLARHIEPSISIRNCCFRI
jgi:hypothetical protein